MLCGMLRSSISCLKDQDFGWDVTDLVACQLSEGIAREKIREVARKIVILDKREENDRNKKTTLNWMDGVNNTIKPSFMSW